MSVMLTKFESKSNRVKGTCLARPVTLLCCNLALVKDSHFIPRNLSSLPLYTTVVCSYGTTAWAYS